MSRQIKGFTNLTYNGHPVWIKDEYEKVYKNKSELERLCDYIGFYTTSLDMAISKAKDIDIKLVYKRCNQFIDNGLQTQYGKGKFQWVRFEQGYINVITYEYILSGNKPSYSGLPFWCKNNNYNYVSYGEYQARYLGEMLLYLLAKIFN